MSDETPANTDPPAIDLHRLRPLEVRVRHRAELPNGGISEAQANGFGRVSADALVLLRALMDEGTLHLSVATLDGETLGPIAPSALFHLWVSFTGHVARTQIPEGDEQAARQIAFCQKVLLLMQLDPGMNAIAKAMAGAEEASVSQDLPEELVEQLHAEAEENMRIADAVMALANDEATSASSERPASTPASPTAPPGDAPSSKG